MKIKINWENYLPNTIMAVCFGLGSWLMLLTIGRDAAIGVYLVALGLLIQNRVLVNKYKMF